MFRMIALMAMAAAAGSPDSDHAQSFGQWRAETLQNGTVRAYTQNRSGSVFGISCHQLCRYYVDVSMRCADGDVYNHPVSGDGIGSEITLECRTQDGSQILSVKDDSGMIPLLKGSAISFAFATENGRFSFSRFSLTGSRQAIAWTIAHWKQSKASPDAQQGGGAKSDGATKDIVL